MHGRAAEAIDRARACESKARLILDLIQGLEPTQIGEIGAATPASIPCASPAGLPEKLHEINLVLERLEDVLGAITNHF